MLLGHLVDRRAKAGGEKSMPEKRETPEDAESAVLQDRRDKAKAGLPESQSPAVQLSHSLLQRLQRCATRGRPFNFRRPPPPTSKAMGNEPIEGDEWDAYITVDTFNTNGTRDGLTGASPKATESS
jgi:hypothetical protein